MTNVSAFFSEFLATAILVFVIFAVTDRGNGPVSAGVVPMALAITFIGITASLGMETSMLYAHDKSGAIFIRHVVRLRSESCA